MSTGIKKFDQLLSKDKPKTNQNNIPKLEDIDKELTDKEKTSTQDFLLSQTSQSATGGTTTVRQSTKTLELNVNRESMRKVETFGQGSEQPVDSPAGGVNSLFNKYSILIHAGAKEPNDFKDIAGRDGLFPKYHVSDSNGGRGGRELSYESILTDFDPQNPDTLTKPYYAADFLYCKYYRKIPLNRMITLRRFLYPTYDNLKFGKDVADDQKPIAQAVTFFGDPTDNDIKNLTKITGEISWKDLEADVWDVQGNEKGFEGTPFLGGTGTLGGLFSNFAGGGGDLSGQQKAQQDFQKGFYGADSYFQHTNKVLGPVNVINKTKTRGRGIGATWKGDIVFDYKLRSFNNINARVAMLDIICNMLALTYNNAKFWGGMNRYFPQHHQFEFFGDQKAFYSGQYGSYIDSVVQQLGNGFGKGLDIISNVISGILSGDLSALTGVLKGGAAKIMDLKAAKSRPQIIGFKALLTGLPVGEWHLTVGNPYNPFMSIGNLICTGFSFSMDGHMGVDDMPSELKFTVSLESGRPRDKGDLESIFNLGQGRSYLPPIGLVDVGNTSASTTNSPANVLPKSQLQQQAKVQSNKKESTGEDKFQFAQKLIGSIY